jgi:SAM-dependent methyltransferase
MGAVMSTVGPHTEARAPGAWRSYDVDDPDPGYFEFDWLSACHPDLYDAFALSTVGLVNELRRLVDLGNAVVVAVGAGTGRASRAVASVARQVVAIDTNTSVLRYSGEFGRDICNLSHVLAHRDTLPLPSATADVVLSVWAELNFREAARLLKPRGLLIEMGPAPGALCGELTTALAACYPALITGVAPDDIFASGTDDRDETVDARSWHRVPVRDGVHIHDFTYEADYGTIDEAAAILGRMYGPVAGQFVRDREQSTLGWRLRIAYAYCA